MSLGTIKDYTPNFNLIIPEFNISGWHDYLEENFRSIDALFYNLFGINNYNGIWKNLTSYTVGQVVFIGEDDNYSGRLVKVLVDHTTTNDDFSTFFENNPTYYELFADASTAQYYALQAKDWAIKTDGPVEGTSYSAKYYADIVNSLSTEITSLYNITNEIQTVASISTDVENVADNATNINTVAGNDANITTVAQNVVNINAVASNQTNINTTATNISSINTAANNITAIQNAPTYATNAANSADLAKQWAIGDPSEPTGNSAKYWANQASSELSTLEGNVSAIQANYVTTNTAQTIIEEKKFSKSLTRTSTIDPTTTTGEVEVRTLSTVTKNGSTVIASYNATRSGTNFSNRQRVNNPNLSNAWYDIRVNVDDAGQGYVNVACSTSVTNLSSSYITSSTSSSYLPTMGWVNNPSTSTNVLHRSGTETASGDKTFSGNISFTGTTIATTQANSDSSTKVATTAYIGNKFQVVASLPATPDPDTFYFIPES